VTGIKVSRINKWFRGLPASGGAEGDQGSGFEQQTAEPQNNEPQNIEGWFRFAQSFL